MSQASSIKFLRKRAVLQQIASSHTKFYSRIKENLFVKPIKIGKSSVWPEHEVNMLCKAMIAGFSDDQLKQLVNRIEADRKKFLEG